MFASGNGGLVNDNCNFDGYANSIYTLTVGKSHPPSTCRNVTVIVTGNILQLIADKQCLRMLIILFAW